MCACLYRSRTSGVRGEGEIAFRRYMLSRGRERVNKPKGRGGDALFWFDWGMMICGVDKCRGIDAVT